MIFIAVLYAIICKLITTTFYLRTIHDSVQLGQEKKNTVTQ
jgi:hypothetical protein